LSLIKNTFTETLSETEAELKERKTITGKRFLLTAHPSILPYKTFVNLDFSFREKVLKPQKSIVETDYPVLFTSYLLLMSTIFLKKSFLQKK